MESLLNCLSYINPDDYDTWVKVGMGLKHEGYSCSDWDMWSSGSSKYKSGVCEKKWNSFNENNAGEVVTGGTIFQMARDNGYKPDRSDQAFGWDDEVNEIGLDYKILEPDFIKEKELPKMKGKPIEDIREYLNLLFDESDYVGYCDKLDFIDDKWVPVNGLKSRTAGQLLADLKHGFEKSTIRGESEGGAMIRFNPLDGQGESDANVTDFRFCMVESDKDSIEKQYALYQEMKLPIVCLVHSGNKSLHAIIHVDAGQDHREYQRRVNFIYEFCKKNGLSIDQNDKNASRYSRLPGIKRGKNYQYIVATNIGFPSYKEWREWADMQNDNLPDDFTLDTFYYDPPALKPELIEGILRIGHKLLISGPSKAGKTFILMNLAICMAEGLEWMGHKCKQGKVLYVNLELDESSCVNRFIDMYKAMGIEPRNLKSIIIWNLRGRAVPMDKLTPFVINRYKEKDLEAIILDPIYKVITGDENNATDMSLFCSYFDRIALEVKTALVYCHHHSKGAGMKYSRASDRASGSGVFARDPDAILDLVELEIESGMEERYREQVPASSVSLSAWALTGTLREFPPLKETRLWFDYPLHHIDEWNFLATAKEGETARRNVGKGNNQISKGDWPAKLRNAYDMVIPDDNGMKRYKDVEDYVGKQIKNYYKDAGFKKKTIDGIEYLIPKSPNS